MVSRCSLAFLFLPLCLAQLADELRLSQEEILALRAESEAMFAHGFDSYMRHALPRGADELRPLSCSGRRYDERERGTLDDSLGGFSLTLVDSLDMLALMGNWTAFESAITEVQATVDFENDVFVSVFEVNIRVLGGLLSAHQLAERFEHLLPSGRYDGGLLHKARDLGERLLPAFDTPTGLPIHRINLRTGKAMEGERSDTCTAAAGSMLVEMGLLSRLTGDARFESAARGAVDFLWNKRSRLGLVGSMIDTNRGHWTSSTTGVGAGVDSFYEYLLKAHLLLGDGALYDAFTASYDAIQMHCLYALDAERGANARRAAIEQHKRLPNATAHSDVWYLRLGASEPPLYLTEVDMHQGREPSFGRRVSALQAFWPGVQAMHGDLKRAEAQYASLLALWGRFRALPEVFDVGALSGKGRLLNFGKDSPIRPELIESTFYLYGATKRQRYLCAAKEMLRAIQHRNRVDCGYASLADVTGTRLDDRMDSFVLSETFKYLYLTFDAALAPESRKSIFCLDGGGAQSADRNCLREGSYIFSTEGHVLLLPDGASSAPVRDSDVQRDRQMSDRCSSLRNGVCQIP